jgi:hypothetical protein
VAGPDSHGRVAGTLIVRESGTPHPENRNGRVCVCAIDCVLTYVAANLPLAASIARIQSDSRRRTKPMSHYISMKITTELGNEKRCLSCGEFWPADHEFFAPMRSSRDGLTPRCIACIKAKLWQLPMRSVSHTGTLSAA